MLLIFDWDGTLCDSTGRIVEAMQLAAVDLELPVPSVAAVRNVIGLGLGEAMAELFPAQAPQLRERMRTQYSNRYIELDAEPAGLFDQVAVVLESLRGRGHLLAVATGKGRQGLNRVLAGLRLTDYFDATRCADETASKPDPLMLRELMTELGSSPAQTLVIGDSSYDLEMARNAGVSSVGVSYGVHSTARLVACGPLAIIDSAEELLSLQLPGGARL